MSQIALTVNRRRRVVNVDADTPLLWVLRDEMGLTGTKYGCGVGLCGACTVLQGDVAVRSCQIPASAADGKTYTTIEGLSGGGGSDREHPCQRAWIEEDVAQCGYCQPGMIMTACALLKAEPQASDADIDVVIDQHVCRCGTYSRIRKAIHLAARKAT